MEVSFFLAKALGLWMTILGVSLLVSSNNFKIMANEYFKFRPVIYLGGLIALGIGCLMIAGHNIVTSQKLMAQVIECLRKLRHSITCAMSFEKDFFI